MAGACSDKHGSATNGSTEVTQSKSSSQKFWASDFARKFKKKGNLINSAL
jgi:hypothetical protein